MANKTELGIMEEQVKILESTVIDNSDNITAYFHLGEIKAIQGLYMEALTCFQRVTAKDTKFLRAYIETAKILIYKQMYDGIYRVMRSIRDLSPHNVEGFVLYQWLKSVLKEKSEIIEEYENFTTVDEEVASFQINYQLKLGQYEKIIKEYVDLFSRDAFNVPLEYTIRMLEQGRYFNKSIFEEYEALHAKIKKQKAAPKKEEVKEEEKEEKSKIIIGSRLEEILREFLRLRSIMHVCVFTYHGEILAQESLKPAYENPDYAKLSADLEYLDTWADKADKRVDFISFEYADGLVFIHALGKGCYFCAVGEGLVNFGALKFTFDKMQESIAQELEIG